jgi:hypothetical protein
VHNLGVKARAQALTTIPDNTSQKFVLVAQLPRSDSQGRYAIIYLDFAKTRTRQCTDSDFEQWYARPHSGHDCVMGHKVRVIVIGFFCAIVMFFLLC